jgi:hypothetical protein
MSEFTVALFEENFQDFIEEVRALVARAGQPEDAAAGLRLDETSEGGDIMVQPWTGHLSRARHIVTEISPETLAEMEAVTDAEIPVLAWCTFADG